MAAACQSGACAERGIHAMPSNNKIEAICFNAATFSSRWRQKSIKFRVLAMFTCLLRYIRLNGLQKEKTRMELAPERVVTIIRSCRIYFEPGGG